MFLRYRFQGHRAHGFCAISYFSSFEPLEYDVRTKDIDYYFAKSEGTTEREIAENIVRNFIDNRSPSAKTKFCDMADGFIHRYIIKHFKDGETLLDRNDVEHVVRISDLYFNPNSGNQVLEMTLIREDTSH